MGNSPMIFRRRITDSAAPDARPSQVANSHPAAAALASLFELSDDGIMLLDQEGVIQFANPSAQHIFGRGSSVVGDPFGIPLVGTDKIDIDVPQENGRVDVFELRVAESRWDGAPARLVTLRDVTERVDNEHRIRELNRELELRAQSARVLNHVGDGIILLDDSGVVRFLNPAAERILSVARETALNAPMSSVVPDWSNVTESVVVAKAPFNDSPRGQSIVVEQQGREIWLSVTGVSFESGTVYAFHDLTEEVRVESLKKDFIDTASHELRTPLTSIYGAAHTLQRVDVHVDDEVRAQLIDVICVQSKRLQRITEDILATRRLDDEPRQLALEQFDARDMAAEIVEATAADAPPGVRLAIHNLLEKPIQLYTDQDKLRQVLVNLVQNAVKYSPEGGEVIVTVVHRDDWVQYEVRDHGIGVSADEIESIFQKFFRASGGRNSTIAGTGLGLYIARELVTRLHGDIWVDSRLGEGSTFFLRIPISLRGRSIN
ncbi:MAG: sensor histidine kinase [Thermoleophilia bacterium]|nr:sensor histidine kinase [Thermoleophilia bacterium]